MRISVSDVCVGLSVSVVGVCLWSVPFSVAASAQPPTEKETSAQFAIEAQVAEVQRLDPIDIQIELYLLDQEFGDRLAASPMSLPSSVEESRKQIVGEKQMWRRWTRSRLESAERLREQAFGMPPRPDGLHQGSKDVFVKDGIVKRLTNWVPGLELLPSRQGITRGGITTVPSGIFDFVPAHVLITEIEFDTRGPRYSLDALKHVEDRGYQDVNGHRCRVVRVPFPEHTGTVTLTEKFNTAKSWIDVYLDPSVNFMVRKVHEHYDHHKVGTEFFEDDLERVVLRFESHTGGCWLPSQVLMTHFQKRPGADPKERKHFRTLAVVTSCTVNEPLPEDALDFRFPENLIVRTSRGAGQDDLEQLWGPDDKPIMDIDFNHPEEVLEYEYTVLRPRSSGSRMTSFFVVNALVITGIGAAWWYRRKKSHSKAK